MPTFNPTQTVFALSMISNVGSTFKGDLQHIEAETYKKINSYLSSSEVTTGIGSWKVIWGPAIYQAPLSDRADNVMVLFQAGADATTPGQLVVGIAGTNPYSAFDWLLEDFFVITEVQWASGNPAPLNPHISLGTYIGLSILQVLTPGPQLPGVGVTLPKYLTSVLASPTPLSIAGHSLGGALSPAVALWLSDTKASWDPSAYSSLACLPSAGPTSGDQDFSTYYGNQLGSVTTRLHNGLDVVPHAWEADDLRELPDLYDPPIPGTLELYALLVGALAISATKDYTQIVPSTPPLPGVFNQNSFDPTKSDCDNYTSQTFYQHVDAYFDLLGIPIPTLRTELTAVANEQLARVQSLVLRKQMIQTQARSGMIRTQATSG
jgi:hypothetical protein